jgi:hypothetical protein
MTDEQINLPPLPVAYNVMGDPLHNNFHAGHMKVYAHAAVLADRAARAAAPAEPTMDDAVAAGDGTLHGTIDRLQAEVERLRALLLRTVEFQDECRYDHHGYCQAHNLQPKSECWVELVRSELGDRHD